MTFYTVGVVYNMLAYITYMPLRLTDALTYNSYCDS